MYKFNFTSLRLKHLLTLCVVLMGLIFSDIAQAQNVGKKDTVVLSVYNNNQKYMLYPMPFYKKWPDTSMVVLMEALYDTAQVTRQSTVMDSTGKKPMLSVIDRQCTRLSGDVNGKVALVRMNPACDVSFTCLMAQRMGAKMVVMIHTTNSVDSVTLEKKNKQTYAYQDSIKIPCYTVRNEIGSRLMQMLPSLVGVKVPDGVINDIQSLAAYPNNNPLTPTTQPSNQNAQALTDAADETAQKKKTEERASPNVKGWQLSPNPANTEALLQFNFDNPQSLTVDIFNAAGQMVTNYNLPTSQAGTLGIDVSSWANGVYSVRLSRGEVKEVKQLVVQK
jgi:Secretion system C-terminal sorting domain